MSGNIITVVAQLRANPNKVDEVKLELKNMTNLTRRESGCISYELHQSIDNDTVFLTYEIWADKSALDKHFESPHFKDGARKLELILAEPAQVMLYKNIS